MNTTDFPELESENLLKLTGANLVSVYNALTGGNNMRNAKQAKPEIIAKIMDVAGRADDSAILQAREVVGLFLKKLNPTPTVETTV